MTTTDAIVHDFDGVSTDVLGYSLITERKIADLRYSIIDGEGAERLIPFRWHSFRVADSTLIILAAFDSPTIGTNEMAVYLNYFKRVTTVEIVDVDSVGHYADWSMKSDMRRDLFRAVKVFSWRAYDTCVLREWPAGTNPAERMETL